MSEHPKLDVSYLSKLAIIQNWMFPTCLPKTDGMSEHSKLDDFCLPEVDCTLET